MTAADGEEPVGQQPAPDPSRTLRFRVSGGEVRRGGEVATTRAADDADTGADLAVAIGQPAALPATLDPVRRVLEALPRQHRPAPEPQPLPSRRHRPHPALPRPRPWYARPVPAVLAVGGLVTVTATGLAEGLAPGAPAGVPAPRGTGSTLRGALLVPEPGPTPAEVPPRTVTVAPPTARPATSPAAEQTSASPDGTTRPKRTRKPRRSRTATPTGTGRSATGGATTPTPDPTGQVTIGPP